MQLTTWLAVAQQCLSCNPVWKSQWHFFNVEECCLLIVLKWCSLNLVFKMRLTLLKMSSGVRRRCWWTVNGSNCFWYLVTSEECCLLSNDMLKDNFVVRNCITTIILLVLGLVKKKETCIWRKPDMPPYCSSSYSKMVNFILFFSFLTLQCALWILPRTRTC